MTAVLVGLCFILFGTWGIIHWFSEFLAALKGFGPISLVLGGIVSLISGIASFRSRRSPNGSK